MRPPALRRALAPALRLTRGHAGCSNPHHHHPPTPSSSSASSAAPAHTHHSHSHSHTPTHAHVHSSAAAQTPSALPHRTPGAALNVPTTAGGPHESAAYCASLVQRLDPDAWLTSYFWPKRERDWWFAIRAFNLELHQVTTTVSQPAIAAMRLQFWRDALSAIYSDNKPVPQHPVAIALAEMRKARPVMKYYLSQMIEVRAKTLSLPPASPSLEEYITTYSPLAGALLQGPLPILLAPSDAGTSHIAHTLSHVANLLAVTTLLRGMPQLAAKRQLAIPSDVLASHGVVEEQVFRAGAEASGLKDAVFQIATRGMDELITARTDLKSDNGKVVPAQTMPLFLAAVPAERYLQRLEAADFDVFSQELQKADWKLAPKIWWTYQTGKL